MADREPLLLTAGEVAELLGCGRSFVYVHLLAPGRLSSIKLGRRRLIARADVEELVERLRAESGAGSGELRN